jgi:hypothetical protein
VSVLHVRNHTVLVHGISSCIVLTVDRVGINAITHGYLSVCVNATVMEGSDVLAVCLLWH